LVRLCRVLGLMDQLDQLVPELGISPIVLLKDKKRQKPPQRVRKRQSVVVLTPSENSAWKWSDDN
jgi:hypothetical protein